MTHVCDKCGQSLPVTGLHFDVSSGVVTLNGDAITLTRPEFEIFRMLVKRGKNPASQLDLFDWLYQLTPEADEPDLNVIRSFIYKMRRKLNTVGLNIRTLHGRGYILEIPQTA